MGQEKLDEYKKAREDINALLTPEVKSEPSTAGQQADPGLVTKKDPSTAGKKATLLKASQCVPANWHITMTEQGIYAECGGLQFSGTMAEFNKMLKSGVME